MGDLGLPLMGGAKLSKPLIQFSVNGRSCIPPLDLAGGQTMAGLVVTSSEGLMPLSPAAPGTVALSPPGPTAGHCQPTPPPETTGHSRQVWLRLLWGRCCFLWGPGAQNVLFVSSTNLFPQSCGIL